MVCGTTDEVGACLMFYKSRGKQSLCALHSPETISHRRWSSRTCTRLTGAKNLLGQDRSCSRVQAHVTPSTPVPTASSPGAARLGARLQNSCPPELQKQLAVKRGDRIKRHVSVAVFRRSARGQTPRRNELPHYRVGISRGLSSRAFTSLSSQPACLRARAGRCCWR